jgi:hypothetical protein
LFGCSSFGSFIRKQKNKQTNILDPHIYGLKTSMLQFSVPKDCLFFLFFGI